MRQLAHEIKNPLGGIRGATQLLQDELETEQPDLVEYTEMVLEQVGSVKKFGRSIPCTLSPRDGASGRAQYP